MKETSIVKLIRKIDPTNFPESLNGTGTRVVTADRKTFKPFKASLLSRLVGVKDSGVHFFVKELPEPLLIDTWCFTWSEGTSAVSLDFRSTFEIRYLESKHDACKFAQALNGDDDPNTMLRALISRHLSDGLRELTKDKEKVNLLTHFRASSVGVGENKTLDETVTKSLSDALGVHFRIGFVLTNMPPLQIEVKGEDKFSLSDSPTQRAVHTTAILELQNLQLHQKSSLRTQAAVSDAIKQSITQAVKRHLFGRRYLEVVQSFQSDKKSVRAKMRADIEVDARRIGYGIKMFQTFPEIPALSLLEPMRIDIPADITKYRPANSTSYVQMEIALSVIADDFGALDSLVRPDQQESIHDTIALRVQQVCQDQIQKFGRQQFNLEFEKTIVPALSGAIIDALHHHGLKAKVIKIIQSPTEEASRFQALRSEAGTRFDVSIPVHAGDAHSEAAVRVMGGIEVTAMAPNGWERFESKDFGFRRDSGRLETLMRQEAALMDISLSSESPLTTDQRRYVAIRSELNAIRTRIEETLHAEFSQVGKLALYWSSFNESKEILQRMQEVAANAIADEFGLSIALRGVTRASTDAEKKAAELRAVDLEQIEAHRIKARQRQIELDDADHLKQLEFRKRAADSAIRGLVDDSTETPASVVDMLTGKPADVEQHRERMRQAEESLLSKKQQPDSPRLPWQKESSPAPLPTQPDDANTSG